jgi:hypothetical protein
MDQEKETLAIKKAIGFVFSKDTLIRIILVQVILTLFVFSMDGIPLRLKNYIPIRLSAGYSAVKVDLSGGGYNSLPINVSLDGGINLDGSIDSKVSGDLDLGEKSRYGFSVLINK